jgi:YHS domain-containing protein
VKRKAMIFFIIAIGISLSAAIYRFSDSSHAIGMIKARGAQAKHPVLLESGKNGYTLIATARVIPPYEGDARVELKGDIPVDYKLYLSEPATDLGFWHRPKLKNNIIYGLQPKDHIALWVVMKPVAADPVCGMVATDKFYKVAYKGKDYFFCSEMCIKDFNRDPAKYVGKDVANLLGEYSLTFYDTKTSKAVLSIPINFTDNGEAQNAGEHHHH